MIITDDEAHRAFEFLKSSEEPHAQAKADLEAIKKHEKALVAKLKLQSGEKTSAAKEDEAYASTEYEQWFLFFCAICCVYGILKSLIYRIPNMFKVLLRGWPPSHLDDGGDWKPE